MHELNARGYAIVFLLGLGAFFLWQKKTSIRPAKNSTAKFRWRLRHAFPCAFFILTALAFLGGALHEPANYDGLAYRTPRVLHWLAENQWHWIHTDFPRLNTRTAGFEWLTAPLFLFTGTDRLEFLINLICFSLLPGRIFALLTRLGVRPRAAWHWMWLLPSGYGYVLQAGSSVNDLFGALMALTAFEFALRAAAEKKNSLLWTSGLAAALMTSAKAFNIVLLLPWAIALFPARKVLLRRPLATFAVLWLAMGASMLPTSILNLKYCGDWTGLKVEQPMLGGGEKSIHLIANAINIPLANLAPPVFPFKSQWGNMVKKIVPIGLQRRLDGNVEPGLAHFEIPELQVEESSGLGFGLSLMLLCLFFKKISAREMWRGKILSVEILMPLAAWICLGILMMQLGFAGPARYLLPFYFLLIAPLLTGAVTGYVFSMRAWRVAAFFIFAIAALLLIVSPPRPLWPANTILQKLDAEHSPRPWLRRLAVVYSVYGNRPESFAPVIAALRPEVARIGFIGFDEPEGTLWKPFGARRVVNFSRSDSAEKIRSGNLHFALVSVGFIERDGESFDAWLARVQATAIREFHLKIRAGQPPEHWVLVKFE